MNTVPEWHLAGDWFDICSCNIPCPCEFAQAPTNNACAGMLAWHVRRGHYGDVGLDGLNLLGLSSVQTLPSKAPSFSPQLVERARHSLQDTCTSHGLSRPARLSVALQRCSPQHRRDVGFCSAAYGPPRETLRIPMGF